MPTRTIQSPDIPTSDISLGGRKVSPELRTPTVNDILEAIRENTSNGVIVGRETKEQV